jgi:hypothetical protein
MLLRLAVFANRNLRIPELETSVVDGNLSAGWNPWEPLLNPRPMSISAGA